MKKIFISLCITLTAMLALAGGCMAAEMSYSGTTLTVSGMESGGTVVHASYNESGVLQRVKIYENIKNGANTIPASTGDRLFLWSGIKTMKPECNALTVKDIEPEPTQMPKESSDNNILMVFFSRAGENWQVGVVEKGNTAVIADYILENINADVFEIEAVDPYPSDYYETLARVKEEGSTARPEYAGEPQSLDQYDTIFLGYPIWNGGLPMIMYTFLEKYDLAGKTVIPFSTHGGSGWGRTKTELSKLCPDAAFIDGCSIDGTQVRSASAQNEVKTWLEGIELPKKKMQNEEEAVLAAFETIQQAMIDKDIETLDKMTKDDKTFTHMSGKVQTKEEFFGEIADGTLNYFAYDISDPVVNVDGKYANLKASTTLTAKVYGASGAWTLPTDAWFEKISGQWIQCNKPQ